MYNYYLDEFLDNTCKKLNPLTFLVTAVNPIAVLLY